MVKSNIFIIIVIVITIIFTHIILSFYVASDDNHGDVSLTEDSGTFTSPRYPDNYPYGTNCTWNITVNPGFVIQLTFTSFTLENVTNCIYDYVEVFEENGVYFGK